MVLLEIGIWLERTVLPDFFGQNFSYYDEFLPELVTLSKTECQVNNAKFIKKCFFFNFHTFAAVAP